jgi:hypothetical protein
MDPYLTSPRILRLLVAVGVTVGMAGCAVTPPSNPTIVALPAKGKSLNEFQQDDYGCRNYASQVVNPAANSQQAQSAGLAAPALGTAGGAAAGALVGAGAGNAGSGAAVGAGSGLLLGSAMGATQHKRTEASLQQQYNNAYAQCITAKGNTIGIPRLVPVMVRASAVIYVPPPYYYYVPY